MSVNVFVNNNEFSNYFFIFLANENGHVDKPMIVNGILKHIPSNIQLKFEEQEFCNIDIEGSFLKCSAIVLKTYKHNIDDQAKNLSQSVKKAQSKYKTFLLFCYGHLICVFLFPCRLHMIVLFDKVNSRYIILIFII